MDEPKRKHCEKNYGNGLMVFIGGINVIRIQKRKFNNRGKDFSQIVLLKAKKEDIFMLGLDLNLFFKPKIKKEKESDLLVSYNEFSFLFFQIIKLRLRKKEDMEKTIGRIFGANVYILQNKNTKMYLNQEIEEVKSIEDSFKIKRISEIEDFICRASEKLGSLISDFEVIEKF